MKIRLFFQPNHETEEENDEDVYLYWRKYVVLSVVVKLLDVKLGVNISLKKLHTHIFKCFIVCCLYLYKIY